MRGIDHANGNTTASTSAGQTWGYGYNGRNRLTVVQASGITVGTYTYNAMGQRIQKVATSPTAITQRYAYDEQGHLIGVYTGTNNRDTIWLGDLPVATVDTAGSTSTINYVTADQLGTPRAVSNSAGLTIWSWSYVGSPFGEQQPTSSNGYVLNLRFAGQCYDAETGTNYNVNRNYEPATGRYLQSDPIGLSGGGSTYGYANADPLSFFDTLGLAASACGCKYPNVQKFVKGHLADAQLIASQMPNGVTAQEVLATSGNETGYGTTNLAANGNYFGLHANSIIYPGQSGIYQTTGNKTGTAVFASGDGFLQSGQAFANRQSPFLNVPGATDPVNFFGIIHQHGYGTGTPTHVQTLMKVLPMINNCLP